MTLGPSVERTTDTHVGAFSLVFCAQVFRLLSSRESHDVLALASHAGLRLQLSRLTLIQAAQYFSDLIGTMRLSRLLNGVTIHLSSRRHAHSHLLELLTGRFA